MKNILIADDNTRNIQLLANILSKSDFNIEFAQNGATAVDLCKQSSFDLILMDIMMPKLNGYESCRKIRKLELHSSTPILFISAKADEDSINKGYEVGGTDYIIKPFNASDLLKMIEFYIFSSSKEYSIKKTLIVDKIINNRPEKHNNNAHDEKLSVDDHIIESEKDSSKGSSMLLRAKLAKIDKIIKNIETNQSDMQIKREQLKQLTKACKQLCNTATLVFNQPKGQNSTK